MVIAVNSNASVSSDTVPLGRIKAVRWRSFIGEITQPVRVSFGGMKRRQTMVVEIETDTGLRGFGETWVNYPQWALAERSGALREGLSPAILGCPLDSREDIMARAGKAVFPYARQAGALGPAFSLLCALEIALLDIEAKGKNISVASLFSDTLCKVPVYASGMDTGAAQDQVNAQLAKGHSTLKFKCGFDFEADIAALIRFREMVGPEVRLKIDANQAFSKEDALRFAERCADLNLAWFEEPMNCRDLEGMAWLREHSPIPIAAGENWYGLPEMQRALEAGAADIYQPDLIKNLTVSDSLILAEKLKNEGLEMAFHNFSSSLNANYAIHLAASVVPGAYVELDATGSPFSEGFTSPDMIIENGFVAAPTGPGFGLSINWTATTEEGFVQ